MNAPELSNDTGRRRSWLVPAVAALVVAAVVAVDPAGYAPFGPVKWLVVTVLVLVAAGEAVRQGAVLHRRSAWVWGGFLVWAGIAAMAGVDPLHAWIGTPDRRFGWIAWLICALAFLVGQQLTTETGRRSLLRAGTVALGAMSAYGLLELAGVSLVEVSGIAERIGGTFGSAAYLGAAGCLLVPLAVAVGADRNEMNLWRWSASAAAVGGVVVVAASQTRGAWIGLAVAAVVTLPATWRWLRSNIWVAPALLVVVAVSLVATPLGDRVGSAVDFEDGGARSRIDEWRIAAATVADVPIIGTGPEGYRIVFPSHVDADYAVRYGRDVAVDRAHNGPLDIGVTTGVPGMLVAVAAAAWLLRSAWRGAQRGDTLVAGLAGAVAAYVAQQQFLFPISEIDPVAWVIAGALVTAISPSESKAEITPQPMMAVALLGLSAVALVAGGADIAADRQTGSAFDLAGEGRQPVALAAADDARSLRPDSIRYHHAAAEIARLRGSQALPQALQRIDDALQRSPSDPVLAARRATMILELARATGDTEAVQLAANAWRRIVARDPNHGGHRLEYGVALTASADTAGAEDQWLAAAELLPSSAVPWSNLAELYLVQRRTEDAVAAVDEALERAPDDPDIQDLAGRIASSNVP